MDYPAFERLAGVHSSAEVVRRTWDLIGRGEFDGLDKTLAPDIVWEIPAMPGVPFAGTWRGLEQVRTFFRIVDAAQERLEFTPSEVIAQGAAVVVLGNFANRVRVTGQVARSNWAQVWKINNGLVASMVEFVDTHAVWEAFASKAPQLDGRAA